MRECSGINRARYRVNRARYGEGDVERDSDPFGRPAEERFRLTFSNGFFCRIETIVALTCLLVLVGCDETITSSGGDAVDAVRSEAFSSASKNGNGHFEVWVVDQSNSPGLTFGGKIHVYDGTDLMGESAASAIPITTLDLAGATDALCMTSTGAHPVRPHMIVFNASHTHAVLAFVASGHVVIYDAAAREPVECIRTTAGAGGSRQAHAAFPSPDDSYILVANQNGKLLERIDADFSANSFTLNPGATLDLANCITPNGEPCESPARPDNAPICPVLAGTGNLAFVTLRGGGLFVVDPTQNPMGILAEYEASVVAGNGCGGAQAGGNMFIDSGGGTAGNLSQFDVYKFPLTGYSASNPPNTPAPTVVFSDPNDDRDAHGMVVSKHERYLWVFDRVANVAEVFDVGSDEHVNTVTLEGAASDDPAPDLADVAPAGNRIFVSLRGPEPLSGDPHVATGSTPGIGIIPVTSGGRHGTLQTVVPISNLDADGIERADPHGIRVRLK